MENKEPQSASKEKAELWVCTVDYHSPKFYKSYLMIRTKSITPSDTKHDM